MKGKIYYPRSWRYKEYKPLSFILEEKGTSSYGERGHPTNPGRTGPNPLPYPCPWDEPRRKTQAGEGRLLKWNVSDVSQSLLGRNLGRRDHTSVRDDRLNDTGTRPGIRLGVKEGDIFLLDRTSQQRL